MCNVFTADGKENLLRNAVPKGITDGRDAVFVFLHRRCRPIGKILGKNKGSNGKMTYGRQRFRCISGPRINTNAADELRSLGFAVETSGTRFLSVFPKSVKKL